MLLAVTLLCVWLADYVSPVRKRGSRWGLCLVRASHGRMV